MIRLRFVTGSDLVSRFIRTQGGIAMPFTPSHVEALSPDNKFYIGAHIDGGIMARPIGYDAAKLLTLPDGSKSERIVSLECTPEMETIFYNFVTSQIGASYDWKSIIDFVMPDINIHDFAHVICSAFIVQALRKCEYFKWPLTVPFHHISPRDLLLMLSSHVKIDH